MSSYIMHICISDIIKRNLNLTDKFVFGAILPDLLKSMKQDRDSTHYIETVVVDSEVRRLPNIQKAIAEVEFMDNEMKLGYIAHLIEDLIWFNDFIPQYAKTEQDKKVRYLKDGTIHSEKEFSQDMYVDYGNSNSYVVERCNVNIEEMIPSLLSIAGEKFEMQPLMENSVYTKDANISNNKFMTKERIDKYIEVCTKEVDNIVSGLMGE